MLRDVVRILVPGFDAGGIVRIMPRHSPLVRLVSNVVDGDSGTCSSNLILESRHSGSLHGYLLSLPQLRIAARPLHQDSRQKSLVAVVDCVMRWKCSRDEKLGIENLGSAFSDVRNGHRV